MRVTSDTSVHAVSGDAAISRVTFREYRAAVDREFRRWHLVTPFARHIGCAAKSRNRACPAAGGTTARRVIVDRIVLEARRSLAPSTDSVAAIGAGLRRTRQLRQVLAARDRRDTRLVPGCDPRGEIRHHAAIAVGLLDLAPTPCPGDDRVAGRVPTCG
jgi:hypothetical protein